MEINEIIELMKAVSDNALTSFELEQGDTKITMKREKKLVQPAVVAVETQSGAAGAGVSFLGTGVSGAGAASQGAVLTSGGAVLVPGGAAMGAVTAGGAQGSVDGHSQILGDVSSDKVVTCPLVGTFYSSPSPDAEDFVKAGDTVKKGQVLGIVEAMKLMNEIECEFDGIVDAVLVKNEEVVEYGQPLFRIR